MKKVICAAAAFAMVAGVASVASAAGNVSLSGDARARWVYNDAGADDIIDRVADAVGDPTVKALKSSATFNSRVRLKIDAKTDSGGYASMRLRFWDHTWGDKTDTYGAMKGADGNNLYTDYAYLGFKAGNVDVSAGKMIIGFTPWFLDDGRADRFKVKYAANGQMFALTFDHKVETLGHDDDKSVYGFTGKHNIGDTVTIMERIVYVADGSAMDRSGFKGSVNVAMDFAGNNVILEQSWKEDDTAGQSSDQYGGYAEWNAAFGAATPAVRLGYTKNGFTADETFGWMMIGGDEPISRISRVGQGGDTWFLGMSSKYAVSEDLNMQANFVYMDIDTTGGLVGDLSNPQNALDSLGLFAALGGYGDNPMEFSGQAVYMINKSTSLTGKLGWLSSDGVLDDALGAYARMAVKF